MRSKYEVKSFLHQR
uniref:Uncharacterized protein n=1 Tax=Anguilla anguilla TaxID=7936 RepID=A0A0E9V7P4_ANGAN